VEQYSEKAHSSLCKQLIYSNHLKNPSEDPIKLMHLCMKKNFLLLQHSSTSGNKEEKENSDTKIFFITVYYFSNKLWHIHLIKSSKAEMKYRTSVK